MKQIIYKREIWNVSRNINGFYNASTIIGNQGHHVKADTMSGLVSIVKTVTNKERK